MQEQRDGGTQGQSDGGSQEWRNSGMQRRRDGVMQRQTEGYRDTEMEGLRDRRMQRARDAGREIRGHGDGGTQRWQLGASGVETDRGNLSVSRKVGGEVGVLFTLFTHWKSQACLSFPTHLQRGNWSRV